jgi:hypothetical protein
MPGLGGKKWSREHAEATAKVVNEINPDFVRLRSLHAVPGTDLYEWMQEGEFEPLGEEDVLREIKLFIETLHGIQTTIVSDHILNLLEELEGKLPEDKAQLLATIDRYFSLPEEDRLIYRVGRRMGVYRRLDDLGDMHTYRRLKGVVEEYRTREPGAIEHDLCTAMQSYI